MPQPKLRKLAAIVSADVVGYSRLMERDEAETLARIGVCFDGLFVPRVNARNGRVVKFMGDGVLAEFSSALDAVICMLQVQKAMTEHEADVNGDHRIEFRIGVNIGDITTVGEDIFGDGVNQAARLQEITQPGGICISAAVYEQVKNKVDQEFLDLGHKKLKNITEPVRVYAAGPGTAKEAEKPAGWPFLSATRREPIAAGGCLCGQVRYKVWSQPVTVGFCHCRHCQLALGAPLNAWAIFEKQNVSLEGEAPRLYASSPLSERAFCQNCGTSLFTDVKDLGYYSIRVGTLDNPADFPPELHFGVESQIPWVDIHDDLPRIRTQDDPQLSSRWVAVGEPKEGPTPPNADRRDLQQNRPSGKKR
ncbi:MAG: GFA family protein [Ruegeria sp.]